MTEQTWLWVGVWGMAIGAAALLVSGAKSSKDEQFHTALHSFVPMVAATLYLLMALGQGAIPCRRRPRASLRSLCRLEHHYASAAARSGVDCSRPAAQPRRPDHRACGRRCHDGPDGAGVSHFSRGQRRQVDLVHRQLRRIRRRLLRHLRDRLTKEAQARSAEAAKGLQTPWRDPVRIVAALPCSVLPGAGRRPVGPRPPWPR